MSATQAPTDIKINSPVKKKETNKGMNFAKSAAKIKSIYSNPNLPETIKEDILKKLNKLVPESTTKKSTLDEIIKEVHDKYKPLPDNERKPMLVEFRDIYKEAKVDAAGHLTPDKSPSKKVDPADVQLEDLEDSEDEGRPTKPHNPEAAKLDPDPTAGAGTTVGTTSAAGTGAGTGLSQGVAAAPAADPGSYSALAVHKQYNEQPAELAGSKSIINGKIEKISHQYIKFDASHNRDGFKTFLSTQQLLRNKSVGDLNNQSKIKHEDMKDKLKYLFQNRKL